MSFARLFIISVVFCLALSTLAAFLMVQFLVGSFRVSWDTSIQRESVASKWDIPPVLQISPELKNLEEAVRSVAGVASKSVVSIVVTKDVPTYRADPFGFFYEPSGSVRRQVGGWTGFFVSKDGYIITNKHVVSDGRAQYSIILADGTELTARVLAYDPTTDLAIIRAFTADQKPYTEAVPLSFITTQNELQIGSFVVAVGNALAEFQNTVTLGVISGLGRQIAAADAASRTTESLTGLIQTDTAINPGNSGGPLIGIDGRVVGINTAVSAGANGIGFAIPLSQKTVDALLASVIKNGTIERAFIGIKYALLTPQGADSLGVLIKNGAILSEVINASPASRAGLKAGDIITEVDGRAISTKYGLREALSEKFPGEKLSLKVYKKESAKTESVELILTVNK
jgi:serine protease Do